MFFFFEVFVFLFFDDESFIEYMCYNFKIGQVFEFYKQYVEEVQEKIQENVCFEFEVIWCEYEQIGVVWFILFDKFLWVIIDFDEELQKLEFWINELICYVVFKDVLLKLFLEKIGFEIIIECVFDNYFCVIFGSYLVSWFVYEFGSEFSQFVFFDFMLKCMVVVIGKKDGIEQMCRLLIVGLN